MNWKWCLRVAVLPIAFLLTGFSSVEEAGNYELENAFRGARPTWPMRGFLNLPNVWIKEAKDRVERERLSRIRSGTPEFRRELELRYGLYYEPSSPNDSLPYGLTKTNANFVSQIYSSPNSTAGEPGLTFNCRGCHAGVFFDTQSQGRVFTDGVSNVFADIDRLDRDIMTAAGSGIGNLFERNLPRNSFNNAADYFGRLLTYVRRPYPSFDRLTAYQAFYARFRMPEHRHLERDVQAYLKTQPWSNVGTKWRATGPNKGLYVDGGFYDNPSSIMYGIIFSVDPNGNDFLAADQGFLERGVPYLATIKAPSYPLLATVDRAAAARGFDVYKHTCSGCHGKYQPSAGGYELVSYPGQIVPIERVGTDPLRATHHGFGEVEAGTSWIKPGQITITNGYKAPPLQGVWARAPYLHNGSVPNLRQLMHPATRTARFAVQPKPRDRANYDERNLGWKIVALKNAAEVAALKKADAYVRIYDPDAYPYGLANTGHAFGAKLTDTQVDDLIAFLKFL